MKTCLSLGTVVLVLCSNTVRAAEEEAVVVFQRVKGCVVSLESVASSGTGIVLDAKGLILTNAHVVAVPLPFKCIAEVEGNGKETTVVFSKVKVVGMHPKWDLALVRIDPGEHKATLQAAVLSKKKSQTGQRVYAIGSPRGLELSISTKTITAGLLSGVDRELEGIAYYQFDAAINPGNSGGPLCDREGNIIGLVTLKASDAENVGFALPLEQLQPKDFKPFAERPTDLKKSGKLIEAANNASKKYSELEKRKQQNSVVGQIYRSLALDFYLEALVENPKNSTIYGAIAVMLQKFGDFGAAEEFFLQSLDIAPWGIDARDYRNYALLKKLQKKPAEAEVIWLEGVSKHPLKAAQLWEDLAIQYRDAGDFKRCARCAAIVLRLNSPDSRQNVAGAMIELCRKKATDPKDRELMERMIAGVGRDLRNMVRARNGKLQGRQSVVTPGFAKYLEKLGRTLSTASIDPRLVVPVPAPPAAKPTDLVDLLSHLDAARPAV